LRGRKQVSLVLVTQLFARHGKRWARQPARDNVNPNIRGSVEFPNIPVNYVPFWSVGTQRVAGVTVPFDERHVLNASLFEAKSLTTGSRTQFKRCQRFHFGVAPYLTRSLCANVLPFW
jgi:hypothetical protein